MPYGGRELRRGARGPEVAELQARLAGFRGTVPDGLFGPLTERQVRAFQRDAMGRAAPHGAADRATLRAIEEFAAAYPIDFEALRCPCGRCGGFGRGRFRGRFAPGKPRTEAFHRYEYPGVHRMLLWALRAAWFYLPELRCSITSGYRCSIDNASRGRSTTNHLGKAIDFAVEARPGRPQRELRELCDAARARLVETAGAQLGWEAPNRKALEPAAIAPTWVHYDVRCYEAKYLRDAWFCTTPAQLDRRPPRPRARSPRPRSARRPSRPSRRSRARRST